MILATGGVSVFKHYCSGELESAQIFSEAICEMETEADNATHACCAAVEVSNCALAGGCCDETVEFKKIGEFQVKAQQELSFLPPQIIASLYNHRPLLFSTNSFSIINKSPPSAAPDIVIRVQSFLL